MDIPKHSVLAVIDQALQSNGFSPRWILQSFFDVDTNKEKEGIILESVKEVDHSFSKDVVGVLCFVNGEEPGKGSIALETISPKVGDVISLCYIAQGIYKGNFLDLFEGKVSSVEGLKEIFSFTVTSVEEGKYVIPLVLASTSQTHCVDEL